VHPENTNTPKILVSACLAGFCCRYDGGHRLNPEVRRWVTAGKACAVCPEKLGGLRSPHPPCEIQGGGGEAVLDGKAKVLDREGRDVTSAYLQGSYRILELVKKLDVREAWLKSKSPLAVMEPYLTETSIERSSPGTALRPPSCFVPGCRSRVWNDSDKLPAGFSAEIKHGFFAIHGNHKKIKTWATPVSSTKILIN